jgi:hypothetical protein
VGNRGTIAHYSNGSWQRLESGTSVDIQDAWGGNNLFAGDNAVLFAASNKYAVGEKKLLRLNEFGLLDSFPWPMQGRRLHSVWFDSGSRFYVCGGGIFEYRVTEIMQRRSPRLTRRKVAELAAGHYKAGYHSVI